MVESKIENKEKKKWFPIMASKEFGNHIIGETYVTELEKSIGKIMSINMMALTNDPKRQNTNVYFEITDKKGTELHTRLIGFEI